MERVISLLFDIEKKANQVIEHANIEKNQLQEENENAISDMEAAIAEENNTKINTITAQSEQDIRAEEQHLLESSKQQLHELEEYYKKNHDAIVDRVFQRIITFS